MKFPPPSFSISFPHQTASLSLFSLDPLLGMHVQSYQILNSEDHANILRKHNKNPSDYRPDIIHQALLMILDIPLNKAVKIQVVYVKTQKGVLFEVKPHVRIPRTYKRFTGIMSIAELLDNAVDEVDIDIFFSVFLL
ncbi:uncharacterized protein LOC104883743 isoform X2 [Beta vulgaris subsp. vulgaris]|uniref:uncharacterized protein LOC104883743 isoform X2 n=1 Tax=Beta vulgaris subsp. vulgaris TaxID=3555 RepID=UPI0020376026|nr:uncharacterized protein LOC104883743 isoform X2 [Beta vulgaris subsp. vulgaris]